MTRWLYGTAEIEGTAASVELCLNRWAAAALPFWRLERRSELVFRCRVRESDLPELEAAAERAWCKVRVLRRFGLPILLRPLRGRPVLILGMLLSILLALFLQNFVWFIRVEGNRRLTTEEILHALEEEGVRWGAWGPDLDSQYLKNRMLNRLPALRWLAVNLEGGVATVLVAEREEEVPKTDDAGVTNLVASRPGVIREIRVLNGFTEKSVGDVVLAGDVLISGVMEWTTHLQATHARGEVYADTVRISETFCPSECLQKVYTGRTERVMTLIFERNRRKISGNSSIFGTMCDTMTETKQWSLPGGFPLPIYMETATLREYVLEPRELPPEEAEALLRGESLRLTDEQTVAGTVQSGSAVIRRKENGYFCRGVWNCLELISRTVPAELFREEDTNGETDQRGTN